MATRTEKERNAALDLMLDKAELHELAMRYARAVDRGDRDLLYTVYHDDAIDHHGNDFRGGVREFAEFLQETAATFEVTAHYIINCSYEVAGDVADGELYFIAYHRRRDSEQELFVSGRYLDRYERRSGTWKIAHRSLVWDWADDRMMTAAAFKLLRERGEGAGHAHDPSYTALPLLAAR